MLSLNNLEIISIAYLMFLFLFSMKGKDYKGIYNFVLGNCWYVRRNGIDTQEKIWEEADLMSRRSYGCQESGGVRCRDEFWKCLPTVFLVDSSNAIYYTTVPQLFFGGRGGWAELDFV